MLNLSAAVLAGRAAAEETHQDTFTAYSPNGTTTDGNGFEVRAYATRASRPARSPARSPATRTPARSRSAAWSAPWSRAACTSPSTPRSPLVGEYGVGWEYVLTDLGPLTDPSLLDSRWLVVDAPAKSYATARRLDVVRLV
jgi:hypothetical protein